MKRLKEYAVQVVVFAAVFNAAFWALMMTQNEAMGQAQWDAHGAPLILQKQAEDDLGGPVECVSRSRAFVTDDAATTFTLALSLVEYRYTFRRVNVSSHSAAVAEIEGE